MEVEERQKFEAEKRRLGDKVNMRFCSQYWHQVLGGYDALDPQPYAYAFGPG